MQDIRRLFMLAYPGQCNAMANSIAKDAFIDALGDKELTIRVLEREPKSMEKAFKIAERMELYTRKSKSEGKESYELRQKVNPDKVRAAMISDDVTLKLLVDNQKMWQEQMMFLMQVIQTQVNQGNSKGKSAEGACNKGPVNCYSCGAGGHVSSNCPEKKTKREETRNKERKRIACYTCGQEGHVSAQCKGKRMNSSTQSSKGDGDAVRKI